VPIFKRYIFSGDQSAAKLPEVFAGSRQKLPAARFQAAKLLHQTEDGG
jgi:hypothetical protein